MLCYETILLEQDLDTAGHMNSLPSDNLTLPKEIILFTESPLAEVKPVQWKAQNGNRSHDAVDLFTALLKAFLLFS